MKTRLLFCLMFALSVLIVFARAPIALADTSHSGTISTDETWSSSGNVHRITGDVTVSAGVTLTIEEGVIVKFDLSRSLVINGSLRVLGTSGNPVHFTSIRDDTVGGDTNGDGSATVPAPGDWYQIQFGENSDDATSLIDHAVIRYGGRAYGNTVPDTLYGAITLLHASPTIQNSTIRDSRHYAYRADPCSFPTLTNNALINNGINGIAITNDVYGSTISCDVTWSITDTAYYLRNTFSVGTDNTLTIDPGVVIKFETGQSLLVTGANSALSVLGTSGDPVHFTSIRDDTVGGDTDNSVTAPAPGDWYQIQFGENSDDATSLIDHAVIRYGGGSSHGAVTLLSASPTIQNSTIWASAKYGVLSNNSTPVLGCNNIYDNGALSGSIRYYGFYNATPSVIVNAENQWWGSTSGPYHSTNPTGGGNAVTDGVDFDPWRTSPCGIAPTYKLYLPLVLRNSGQ